MDNLKRGLLSKIKDTAFLSKATMYNSMKDLSILHSLNIDLHPKKIPVIKSCYWEPPSAGEVRITSDGASRGNPGKGGTGFIIRNHLGAILRTFSVGMGTVTSFMAECNALVQGLQCAASNGWLVAWSESDSVAAVKEAVPPPPIIDHQIDQITQNINGDVTVSFSPNEISRLSLPRSLSSRGSMQNMPNHVDHASSRHSISEIRLLLMSLRFKG
ncbi:hypothetical protein GIB67_017122 [Kingdonia uniflora]|uniref:RNase H type-1 domain-containing protein n=1 Tax=Kingdonia uniflora TaxID=39325 RepID=A0A7J7NCD3_9MAGN|nr:hypothetical protein GIB67_017122 [Kingdonia uniflora]